MALKLRGAISDAKARQKADAARRAVADGILDPTTLYNEDVSGKLTTTLGGVNRAITIDDLKVFKQKVDAFEAEIKRKGGGALGGISPRAVIDMALAPDLRRARKEITRAVLHNAKNGVLHFITNAGPNSTAVRHHVHIEMMSFNAAAAAATLDPQKAARKLRAGAIKFDCDCGRHTFWYRYIATIGRWAYGRQEGGYPKIRNPNLNGVACKHVIRVVSELESSPFVLAKLAELIDAARKHPLNKGAVKTSQKEADEQHAKDERKIKTSDQRATEAKKARERRAAKRALSGAPPPKKLPPGSSSAPVDHASQVVSALRSAGKSNEEIRSLLTGMGVKPAVINEAMKNA